MTRESKSKAFKAPIGIRKKNKQFYVFLVNLYNFNFREEALQGE